MDPDIAEVQINTPIEVRLAFEGIATYKVLEFAPKPGGGWVLDKTLQSAGHSHDAQADNYSLTQVAAKDAQRFIYLAANLSSVTGAGRVAIRAQFFQGGNRIHEKMAEGTDNGSLVQLIIRTILKGA